MSDIPADERANETRRPVVETGVRTAGAIAAGTGIGAGPTAATGRRDRIERDGLLFAANFHPQRAFEVIARLEQRTTIALLQTDGEPVDEISRPDEWNGYVVRYDGAGDTAGVTTFVFVRGAVLEQGDVGTLAIEASVYSSELTLIRTAIEVTAAEQRDDEGGDESVVAEADEATEGAITDDGATVRVSPCTGDGERYDWCQ